jgi:hypothetical protein
VSRSKNRPPRLEATVPVAHEAAPLTPEARLEHAKVAGAGGSGPGPTELRRLLERMAVNDRRSLGELAPMPRLSTDEAWAAVTATYGATPTVATIDAVRTLDATRRAAARIVEVGTGGARIAVATARPASLLTVHMAWARLAAAVGADVVDLADFGPIRADGRTSRCLRWIGSVAVVSDGRALCNTGDGEEDPGSTASGYRAHDLNRPPESTGNGSRRPSAIRCSTSDRRGESFMTPGPEDQWRPPEPPPGRSPRPGSLCTR